MLVSRKTANTTISVCDMMQQCVLLCAVTLRCVSTEVEIEKFCVRHQHISLGALDIRWHLYIVV